MADLYDRMHQTTTAFLDSYKQENVGNDIKALSSSLTPTCRRYYLPLSMLQQAPVLAAGTGNEEYEQQMLTEFTHVWKEWQVEIKDILVDERARKSVGHMVTHMTTKGGQRYDFEFIFKLLLTEDGTQIEKVEEFVDTALAAQVMAEQKALAEALQSKA